MKRSAARQFDAKSTEPADTHNHFTTHMPVAHARQHRSTSNHDPPDRVHGRWEEETTGKDTPRTPGTRATEAPRRPRKPSKKKKFSQPKAPHRSTSHHDPPDRVHGGWEEETMAKITPTPPGTRATEALGGPRKPPKKKNFPSRRHPTPYICLRDFVRLPPGTIELSETGTLFSSGHKTFSTWNFDVIFFREH